MYDLCGYCGYVVEYPCEKYDQAERCVVYLVGKDKVKRLSDVLDVYRQQVGKQGEGE